MRILGIDPGSQVTGFGLIEISNLTGGQSQIAVSNVNGGQSQILDLECGFQQFTSTDSNINYISSGTISTATKQPMPLRLLTIYEDLRTIITEFQPQLVVLERIFVSNNPRAALTLGQARGAAMLAAAQAQLSVIEYSPNEVKSGLSGHGHASKHNMQLVIQQLFALEHLPKADAADALALAYYHYLVAYL